MTENRDARSAGRIGRASGRAQQRRRERERRQRRAFLALAGAVLVLLTLCGWRYAGYVNFQKKRAAVEVETFFAGTHVEGVDVSGMTLAEAERHWAEDVEPAFSGRAVTLSDGTSVTSAMVGYTSNYLNVLEAAYAAGRSGGLGDRYEALSAVGEGVDYVVTRAPYTSAALEAFVRDFTAAVNVEPVAAKPSGLNLVDYTFMFSGGVDGRTLNEEALARDLRAAFDSGLSDVALEIEETPAPTPANEYGMIAYVVTNASSSSTARLHNISTAVATINGTKLEPGETFSFNGVVGERTKANGYRKAKAYYGMADIMEYGGGICQVSSTLYACVLGAKLQVDERHEHSRRVWYVKTGYDATVDWGEKDLKFTNNRDEPIYIGCYVDKSEKVRVAIFGRLQEDDPGSEAPAPGAK